ncbi:uncharacterized protein [Pyrus communis]|uniref:uncharacterized protein n=1 Tax=Pyrus communis TaxID=23211 RepID=UPI0035C11A28
MAQIRREDEESDEKVQVRRNKQNRATAMAGAMVNSYLQHKQDKAGHPGFSPHQKVNVALQMMAYDSLADSMDETHVYKDEYLREPNQEDLNQLIRKADGNEALAEDGLYPKWVTLVHAEKLFTLHQEAYWKDVERTFSILQARWKIISELARGWSRENLDSIMMSCIILHNMIVEDERDGYIDRESDDDQEDPNRSRRAHAKIYDGPNLPFNPRTGSISINE